MEDLEKKLSQLPRFELSKKADFKIKFKIYSFIFTQNLQKIGQYFFHPHSLLSKISLNALAVFVVLGSTAVYAVNNDHIAPGHTFYPLKKTIENVEQQLSLSNAAKVDTLNKLSERRLKEALNLAEHNDTSESDQQHQLNNNIEQSINEAVNNFDSAVETSQKIDNTKNSKKTKDALKKKQEVMVKYLDDISNVIKDNEDMVKKVDEAKKAINKYDQVLDRDRDVHIRVAPKDNELNQNNDRSEQRKYLPNNLNNNFNTDNTPSEQNSRTDRSDDD